VTTIKLTEADVQNCSWTYTHRDEFHRYYIGKGTHPVSGVPIEVLKKEPIIEAELLKLNTEERNARDSKPWSAGAGSDKGGNVPLVRVARIPIAKFFADAAGRLADKDHLPWLLNSEAYKPFRTRTGKL
jgi:hypothetical protein